MATMTMSQFGDLMKKVIEPIIQDQLFRNNVLLSQLTKGKNTTFKNDKFFITAMTSGHSGVYSAAEGGTIKTGKFGTKQMQADVKYTFGSHIFTDQALEAIKGGDGSIASLLTTATEELKMSIDKDRQRQSHGYGQGVLAEVQSGSTGTTITVKGSANGGLGTWNLYDGQELWIGTKSQIEAGTADAVTVVNVTSNTTFTVSGAVTVAANDLIVKADAYNASNAAYVEMSGIRNLIDDNNSPYDANFQGVARSTNAFVNAYVYKGTAEALSIARIQEAVMEASKWGRPNLMLSNSILYNKYSNLLEGQKRFVDITVGTAGFKGLAFASNNGDIALMNDYDAPLDHLEILDTTTFTVAELTPVKFMDTDGQVLRNVGGNSANFQAIMKHYAQLVNLKPRANAILRNQTA